MFTAAGKKNSFLKTCEQKKKKSLKNAGAKITCFGKFKYFMHVYLQGVGSKTNFYFNLNTVEK